MQTVPVIKDSCNLLKGTNHELTGPWATSKGRWAEGRGHVADFKGHKAKPYEGRQGVGSEGKLQLK